MGSGGGGGGVGAGEPVPCSAAHLHPAFAWHHREESTTMISEPKVSRPRESYLFTEQNPDVCSDPARSRSDNGFHDHQFKWKHVA